nr:DUF4910 domain-containing protein [Marinomonas ostreistagni]
MYQWAQELYPIPRSLTGQGVRDTLAYLQDKLPGLTVHSVATGTKVFDWEVPNEWNIRSAWIEHESGERIVDFHDNNLHVLGYSEPVDRMMSLEELQAHLYSLPEQPDAIPYVTSYYKRRWGFCLTQQQRDALPAGNFRVHIDSDLAPGVLNYGELLIPGETEQEVMLSTYVCHPSMANNEVSGPVVATALAQHILALPKRRFSYRILFLPETIGSITYLSKHLDTLKQRLQAGFIVTCVGDERDHSYVPSRHGHTLADQLAKHTLKHTYPDYSAYTWLDRGSDERQFCAPGVDLPVCSMMRSKYGEYPEYHTSLDDMDLISPNGLYGGYLVIKRALDILEANYKPKMKVLCEPQLGKRGLYPTVSSKDHATGVRSMMNFISYCDGSVSLLDIAELINVPAWDLIPIMHRLAQEDLIEYC